MKVGVIGLGYVGLPLAVAFAEAAAEVVGVDVDAGHGRLARPRRVDDRGHPVGAPGAARRRAPVPSRPIPRRSPTATRSSSACRRRSPTSASRTSPTSTPPAATVAKILRAGQLVVLESTTYPGTTRERLAPILGGVGPQRGRGLPPRVLARAHRPRPDRLHGAHDAEGGRRPHRGLLRARRPSSTASSATTSSPSRAPRSPSSRSSSRTSSARSTSRSSTSSRCLADRMGIDVWEVVEAASTKPFGFMRFDPGPGMGGHCLPIDPFYLAFKAREYDFPTEFIELAGRVNQAQPQFCVERAMRALNDVGKPAQGSRDPAPRRLLQGRHRRHARVAGAQDRRDALRARRRGLLPRPPRPGRAGARARKRPARSGPRRVRPGRDRHRARRDSTSRTWSRRRSACSTFAESPAASKPITSYASEDLGSCRLAGATEEQADRVTLGLAALAAATAGTVAVGELAKLTAAPREGGDRGSRRGDRRRPCSRRPSRRSSRPSSRRRTPSRSRSRATRRRRAPRRSSSTS